MFLKKIISSIVPEFVKHKYRLNKYPVYKDRFDKNKELSRLKSIKRYESGISNYASYPIEFVDAPTFIHGYEEIFEKEIYKFQPKNSCPIIIDCGANIGLATIYFKMNYPKSQILAFEPDPHIVSILKRNVENLKLDNVEVFQQAVWINNDGIEFNMEGGFSGRIPYDNSEKNLVKVSTIRLKDIISQKIDFLKIDIEGAENKVIFDIDNNLHFVSNIFIEYHSHENEPQLLGDILNILSKNGFRYHIQEAFTRKQPFIERDTMLSMDLQLNIFGYRDEK